MYLAVETVYVKDGKVCGADEEGARIWLPAGSVTSDAEARKVGLMQEPEPVKQPEQKDEWEAQ